jgi:hypothetical protein
MSRARSFLFPQAWRALTSDVTRKEFAKELRAPEGASDSDAAEAVFADEQVPISDLTVAELRTLEAASSAKRPAAGSLWRGTHGDAELVVMKRRDKSKALLVLFEHTDNSKRQLLQMHIEDEANCDRELNVMVSIAEEYGKGAVAQDGLKELRNTKIAEAGISKTSKAKVAEEEEKKPKPAKSRKRTLKRPAASTHHHKKPNKQTVKESAAPEGDLQVEKTAGHDSEDDDSVLEDASDLPPLSLWDDGFE